MSKFKHFLPFLPAALWYGLIWSLSAQPADVSTSVSNSVMGGMLTTGDILASGSNTVAGGSPVTDSTAYSVADETVQYAVKELLSFFIRKGAHMFLFFVMAILIWYALAALNQKRPFRTFCTILPCAALAALDELHQTFVPGRSGEVRDVLVDLSGSLIALLLFSLPVIGLWLCRKLSRPEWVWPIGALCGTALLFYVGLLKGLAPIFVTRVGNSEFFCSLPTAERSALVDTVTPILRQFMYLLASAVTGFLSAFLAVLSNNRRAVIIACCTALCLSLISGMLWSLPALAGLALCFAGNIAALILRRCFPLLSK